jgi:uncharacterized membrane protein YfcA
MLEAALAIVGVDASIRMHVAVATSLATIIPTSISSARAHHRRHAIDPELIRYWSPYIVAGAIAGIVIAANVGGWVLAAVFATVAFAAAIKMVLPLDDKSLATQVPRTLGYVVAGWGHAELPFGSLGYVNLLGFALIAPATVLFAPLGAKIAHALSRRSLSLLFGLFLSAIAIRMTLRALAW